jgi:hypothetical protein
MTLRRWTDNIVYERRPGPNNDDNVNDDDGRYDPLPERSAVTTVG